MMKKINVWGKDVYSFLEPHPLLLLETMQPEHKHQQVNHPGHKTKSEGILLVPLVIFLSYSPIYRALNYILISHLPMGLTFTSGNSEGRSIVHQVSATLSRTAYNKTNFTID